jgi:hypothetical protein
MDTGDMRNFLVLYRPALRFLFATYARSAHPLPPLSAATFPSFNPPPQSAPTPRRPTRFTADDRKEERRWWRESRLNPEEFLQLVAEWGVCPMVLTVRDVIEQYRVVAAQVLISHARHTAAWQYFVPCEYMCIDELHSSLRMPKHTCARQVLFTHFVIVAPMRF